MQEIETIEVVYHRLLGKLNQQGFNLQRVKPINQGRYFIAFGENECVLVTYKRDTFHNFGKQFEKLGYKGVGDSLNVEDLKECLRYNVNKIYTVFPNGIVYKINLIDFLNKSLVWTNKEGKLVRSISIHEYKKDLEL